MRFELKQKAKLTRTFFRPLLTPLLRGISITDEGLKLKASHARPKHVVHERHCAGGPDAGQHRTVQHRHVARLSPRRLGIGVKTAYGTHEDVKAGESPRRDAPGAEGRGEGGLCTHAA